MTSKEGVTQSLPPVGNGPGGQPPEPPTRELPATKPPGPGATAPPPDTFVTRLLAATTHLQGSYAEQVIDQLLDPSFVAVAPSWGVDLLALARHAMLAQSRRHARDRLLRYLLGGTIALVLLAIASWPLLWLSPFWSTMLTLAIVIVGWMASWQVVFAHYDQVRRSSLEVMNQKVRVRDVAPPLDEEDVEARIDALADANVVVFGGYSPFVGDGQPLDSWTISFDLEPALNELGSPGTMDAFSVRDFYDHLVERVPKTLGGIPGGKRLYVNGTAARAVPGLVPDPMEPENRPVSHLPDYLIDRYVDAPTETARTYVWFTTVAWGSDLRITALIRAEVTGGRLFIEGRSHALLPVQQVFRDVKFVPAHPGRAWLVVARPTTGAVTPLWLSSISRHLSRKNRIRKFMRRVRKTKRDLSDRVLPMNYGAGPSLREDAADAGELKYYATVDEVQRFTVMTRTVMDSMRSYLKSRHIDVTQFGIQSEGIINQTSIRLHPIKGAGDNFGRNSTVTINQGIVG